MIEKFKKPLEKGNKYAWLLRNLFKAFDCLQHEPVLAKIHLYGFEESTARPDA